MTAMERIAELEARIEALEAFILTMQILIDEDAVEIAPVETTH